MYTVIIFVAGVVVGTIFHAVIVKWSSKVKATAQEFAHDVETEAKKVTTKR